jgi:hypothetical protein
MNSIDFFTWLGFVSSLALVGLSIVLLVSLILATLSRRKK